MQRFLVIAGLVLLTHVCAAQSKMKPMTDSAMDHVTAAGMTANLSKGVVNFQGQVPTAKGLVSSAGSLSILPGSTTTNTTVGSLSLNGNAQQNLSSLINLNAVNSKVNVLLNLNVNINSTVGTLTQTNLTAKH
jgi:hypothetical protein